MVGEYVFSNAHNFGLTLEFATSFYPSYFAAQEASVAPRISTTKHVIQIDGHACGSSPINMARETRAIMPQSFRFFNTEEEHTLLARGEETTSPQVASASNSHVPGVYVH
jgi:hypothetical protein